VSQLSRERSGKATTGRGGAVLVWPFIILLTVVTGAISFPVIRDSWREALENPERFLLFTGLFLLAFVSRLQFEFGRQAYLVTLSDVPLAVGLFWVDPTTLLVTRLLAGTAVQIRRRHPLQKACFNVVIGCLEVIIAVRVVEALGLGQWNAPSTWGTAYLAMIVALAAGAVPVFTVIGLVQGLPRQQDLIQIGASILLAGVLNTTVALVVVMLVERSPWASILLLIMAAVLILGYRAYERSVKQHRRLGEMYELTRALEVARREGTLVDVLLTRVRDLMNAEYATLWLPAQGRRHPEVLLSARLDTTGLLDMPPTPALLRELAVNRGETIAVGPKMGAEETRKLLREHRIKDAIVVPLRSGQAVIGCLEVANRLGDLERFDQEDVRLLETLGAHAAVAVENSRLVDRLRFDAYHDGLTLLANRRRMLAALEEAVKIRAPGEVVAVMQFDVDSMRDVNDSLGHQAGDKLLVEVARRLSAAAPPGALVGRVGGDEFTVLLRIESADAAEALARQLREALQEPFGLGALTVDVDTTVGIAVHPDHGSEPEILLQRADLANQTAKQVSSSVALFNLGMESRSVRRLGLAGDLRRALDAGQIEVYFQPKVALRGRALVGVECLARWEHPSHGSVAPEDFITVAEHTGQLGRLTEVVLREGLQRCRQWADEGRPLGVAVNLSPRTLSDPAFPSTIEELLSEYNVEPDRLTLEITEHGMVAETDKPLPTLRRLHDMGIRLSVDDFGTGYSSLSYLRRLPVHEVKVDRTFVQNMATDPGDLAIVRAVVDLSRHFGYSVVAEGVESELTLSLLEDMGCDVGQGFLFSRPLPYERLETWFGAQTELEPTPAGTVRRLRLVP